MNLAPWVVGTPVVRVSAWEALPLSRGEALVGEVLLAGADGEAGEALRALVRTRREGARASPGAMLPL